MADALGGDDLTPPSALRRGWTTGACATAATQAAYEALLTGSFPAAVEIVLPSGARPSFAVAMQGRDADSATAGIIKDAGDDPDVTHGAMVKATVRLTATGNGIVFRAGPGVGIVTKPGLPIPPGQPAINPVPRKMIAQGVNAVAELHGGSRDIEVEISVSDGQKLAQRTLNPRLGIVGGLSILGTTGIVVPFSCSAWIHSIYRGIDVARAMGISHIVGSTGNTSEVAAQKLFGLPDEALIEMGDFVGGMLKYLRRQPVARVTIAGGVAKMCKLGQGLLDLHSKRGEVDRRWLAEQLEQAGAPLEIIELSQTANTAQLVVDHAINSGISLGDRIADMAWNTAAKGLFGTGITLDVIVIDRNGRLIGQTPPRPDH